MSKRDRGDYENPPARPAEQRVGKASFLASLFLCAGRDDCIDTEPHDRGVPQRGQGLERAVCQVGAREAMQSLLVLVHMLPVVCKHAAGTSAHLERLNMSES